MKTLLYFAVLRALCLPVMGPGIEDGPYSDRSERLDSTVVSASRAGASTPVTYTSMSRSDLSRSTPLGSLPMALGLQPSVVSMNEGGTGIGYSKLTIRGSKGSQINVTLNGITLNDAESQKVFWVNIPSLQNLLSSVQLQRGLGTSASGAGAFGASINMSTASVGADPYATVDLAAGSYNTFTSTVSAGTGLLRGGFYLDAAYSRNYTDGYIDNAFARVQSVFAALGWMDERNSLRLTYLMGDQHTGITWNGISRADIQAYGRTYNSAGLYCDADGNYHRYSNDTDNYTQHHLQLNYTRQFARELLWVTTFNWTNGDGWYDEYKSGKKFGKYGFSDEDLSRLGTSFSASDKGDFIVLKAMANNYFVVNSQLSWKGRGASVVGGVNLSQYNGNHYGDVCWSSLLGDGFDYGQLSYGISPDNDWYYGRSIKREANAFVRAEYSPLSWLTAYADLQYRAVWLHMSGTDYDNDAPLDYATAWHFFNPRAGVTFAWNPAHKAFLSAALGHREPGRSDIKEVVISNNLGGEKDELRPEKMLDIELGYNYNGKKFSVSANLYFMEYWDMLIETGRLTSVGYAIKENASRSYRRGVELAASYQAAPWLRLEGNLTLSLNRLRLYTCYADLYDNADSWNYLGQAEERYENTPILMSPSVIGMGLVTLTPWRGIAHNPLRTTALSISCKGVGRQYWDNTGCTDRSLPGYYVANIALTHEFDLGRSNDSQPVGKGMGRGASHAAGNDMSYGDRHRTPKLGLGLYVNNFTNNMYISDAWVYRTVFESGDPDYIEEGLFPQAPANFMFKVSLKF